MAVQNGTEVATGSQEITFYDTIEADSGNAYKTKFKAIGTAGEEIGTIYILNADGTYGDAYTQVAASPADKQFTYAAETKVITFAESKGPAAGDKLACAYTFKTADNAQRIELNADAVPSTVLVSAYGLVKDICTGELFQFVLEGQAVVDGNWSFELTADGDPAVQNLSMEFVKSCVSNKLYDMTVYTEDEAV